MVASLLLALRRQRIFVALNDGRLSVKGDKNALNNEIKQQLGANKAAIIELLQQLKVNSSRALAPCSFGQQRIWFIDQLEQHSVHYNMPSMLRISGDLDIDKLQWAFNQVLARHDALRTVFASEAGEPYQVIRAFEPVALDKVDLTSLPAQTQQQAALRLAQEEGAKPFDLANDAMLRGQLLLLDDNQYVLLFTMHHIVSDGWSMGNLVSEINQLYLAAIEGLDNPLPPLSIQYADYAHWQRQWLESEQLQQQLDYWQQQLADVPTVHSLSLDYPRPEQKQYAGELVSTQLPLSVAQKLKQLANTHKMTPFMLLHASLALVLSRHSNAQDIVIGTPVANRNKPELEPLIGFFVNSLVLRVNTAIDAIDDYFAHVRKVHLDAQANQDVPFELLVEKTQVPRSSAHGPLFQILFTMDTNTQQQLSLPGLSLAMSDESGVAAKFDLDISADFSDRGLNLTLVYDKALFSAEHVARYCDHWVRLLSALADGRTQLCHQLPMLSLAEREYQLSQFNQTQAPFPQDKLIHELFTEQANRHGERGALYYHKDDSDELACVSYEALNQQVNRLAHYLQGQGVGPETMVGLCLYRSREMVVAIMAVLKAGGAYVPIDPSLPEARIEFILSDTNAALLLTQQQVKAQLQLSLAVAVCAIDSVEFTQQLAQFDSHEPTAQGELNPHSAAYVIYTSGSTGQPKGVVVEHQALVNRIDWMQQAYGLDGLDKVLQKTPYSFDVSVWEFVWPLSYGAALVVAKPGGHQDPSYLSALIANAEISVMHFVPSMLSVYLQSQQFADSVRLVFCSGEALNLETAETLKQRSPHVALHNLYGPTEAAIDVSYFDCARIDEFGCVPIGKPINNIQLLVLDKQLNLCPVGVPGELHIAGVGLARGYLNRADLTDEKFIHNPFTQLSTQRLYKTGDLVSLSHSGELMFHGRIDHQVKIRGFRIELGEIEQQLASQPAVKSALLLATEGAGGEPVLLAYVQPHQQPEDESVFIAALKAALGESLPEYMVPGAFVMLMQWPLNANGKIDRKALPAPDRLQTQGQYVAPSSDLEKTMVCIWAELLKLDAKAIGIDANFFEIGGHSLLAMRLIAQIRATAEREVAVKAIFDHPTVRRLCAFLDGAANGPVRAPVVAVERTGDTAPMSFAQQRLWFIDHMHGGSAQYNMPMALKVSGEFDLTAATKAINAIIARHETLRTVFVKDAQGPKQQILDSVEFAFAEYDLSADEQWQSTLDTLIAQDAHQPFDLTKDLMVRAGFIRLPQDSVLLFNTHHIASDGWSMGIFLKEFAEFYRAALRHQPLNMTPLALQYADFAHWQRQWLDGGQSDAQLAYWQQQLADVPTVHGLVLDKPRPEVKLHEGATVFGTMDKATSQQLQQLANRHGLTLFMLLHGALALVLARHGSTKDIVIGTAVAGRMQAELESIIGFFVNTLALRVSTDFDSVWDYFAQVKQVNLEAQANQDVSFEQVVEHCRIKRAIEYTPLFQILFTMDTTDEVTLDLPGASFKPVGEGNLVAKYDMDISAQMTDQGLAITWIYDKSLFEQDTVAQYSDHLERLLVALCQMCRGEMAELNMMSAQQVQYLTRDVNAVSEQYPAQLLIHELFERQVALNPEHIAYVFEDKSLTYAQLNELANRLAHYLRELGVGSESLVGICVERCLEMIPAMLAVLKAGGAYVPLDPGYPAARLEFMIEDTALTVLLTQQGAVEHLAIDPDIKVMALDSETFTQQLSGYSTHNPERLAEQHDHTLAYVIYTSGSTGQPKGVMVEHRQIVTSTLAREHYYREPLEKFLSLPSISFDASLIGILWTLTKGGELHYMSAEHSMDTEQIYHWVNRHQITHMTISPAMYTQLQLSMQDKTPQPSAMRCFLLGGEALEPEVLEAHMSNPWSNRAKLFNEYGPTEGAVWASVHVIDPNLRYDKIPIGRNTGHCRLYLLDKHQLPVPFGAIGELYIAGNAVARGYLNQPEMTAERFVGDPFAPQQGQRMYKTGDLARYIPALDGNGCELEFMGRIDEQVKIRGFRIELGEIKNQLAQCPGVATSYIYVREDHPGDKRIVAYVVPDDLQDLQNVEFVQQLRIALKQNLADYMVPSAFVLLKALPLTINGKVDKKALMAPDTTCVGGQYVAAKTETETTLTTIWGKLLGLDPQSISITANYFDLGGHSLLAVRMVSEIRSSLNKELQVKAIFEAPDIESLAKVVDNAQCSIVGAPISRYQGSLSEAPLSFAQQRLWFIDRLEGRSSQYNMPAAMRIFGDFDPSIAEQALAHIIERHLPLRSVYKLVGDTPVQKVLQDVRFTLQLHDLQHLAEQQRDERVAELARIDAAKPFDLANDLMLRASFIRLGGSAGVLLLNLHHIASDGWSMGLLSEEFALIYHALKAAQPVSLEPLPLSYIDYAAWQHQWLEGGALQNHLEYWAAQVEGLPTLHSLPSKQPRPVQKGHVGRSVVGTLDGAVACRLEAFAKAHQMTPFMLLHATLALVLSRNSNSQDIVIGTPVANRTQSELERLIGFFVNTLVLRVNTGYLRLDEYFAHVRRVNLDAQMHQAMPFEQLVEHCQLERSGAYSPMFQIMLSLNDPQGAQIALSDFECLPLNDLGQNSDRVVKFDIDINATFSADGVGLELVYDKALFDGFFIEQLLQQWQRVLTELTHESCELLPDLPILCERQIRQLTDEVNDSDRCYEQAGLAIHQVFERIAKRSPEQTAVVYDGRTIDYHTLNLEANRLAHYLKGKGIGEGTMVGLCVNRSIEMIIATLAILKAGGAYVPLDPTYPAERLAFMLDDTKLGLILSQRALMQTVSFAQNCEVLCLDGDDRPWQQCATSNIVAFDQWQRKLAYIIYTSGSTGQPKGVMLAHDGAVNLAAYQGEAFAVQSHCRVLQFASLGFDACVWEWMMALLNGASLYICTEAQKHSPETLGAFMSEHKITHATLPPALLKHIELHGNYDFERLIVAGEAIDHQLAKRWAAQYPLINAYGPSETTVCASLDWVSKDVDLPVTIGRAIANTQLYVLNEEGALLPPGVVGELYIGGAGVALGYLNRPELNEERFVYDSFKDDGSLMYRSGDLVRLNCDGSGNPTQFEFVGRIDSQVKVRGFRIELGEIEHQLTALNAVASSVVLTDQDANGELRLHAYVIPEQSDDAGAFEQHCKQALATILPSYMIPTVFTVLKQWPITANGKIDKKALQAMSHQHSSEHVVTAQSDTERQLSAIWCEVLQYADEAMSIDGDFFAMGGHSLLAVTLMARINQAMAVELSLKSLFDHPTIGLLAAFIDQGGEQGEDNCGYGVAVSRFDGALKTLFVAPALGMTAAAYQPVVQGLSGKLNVAILTSPGIDALADGDDPLLQYDIKQRVEAYLAAILALQPNGHYYLLGHSFGGVIAFELARALELRGNTVDILLADSLLGYQVPGQEDLSLPQLLLSEQELRTICDKYQCLPEALSEAQLFDSLTEKNSVPVLVDLEVFQRYCVAVKKQMDLYCCYRPSAATGAKLTLIEAHQGLAQAAFRTSVHQHIQKVCEQPIKIVDVAGTHFSLIEQTSLFTLLEDVLCR